MEVDGTLHLWTTLLGWHYYNVIWALLTASGIAILPIVGIVLDHIIDVRSRGSLLSSDGDSSLAPLEVQLFLVVMVVLLFVRPSGLTALSSATLSYTPQETVYGDPTTPRQLNATNTARDDVLDFDDYDLGAGSIPVPPMLYLVMQVSNGFRYALINNIDTRGEVYRAMRGIVNRVAITNPGLKSVVNDFNSECYGRALSRYRSDGSGATLVQPAPASGVGSDQEGPDIGWLGSRVFQSDIYPQLRVSHPVPEFAFDPDVDTEYSAGNLPANGAPLCSEYWVLLRDKIYGQAVTDGTVGIIDRSQVKVAGVVSWPAIGSDEVKDEVARTYLSNTEIGVSQSVDTIFTLRRQGDGRVAAAIRNVTGFVQAYELGKYATAAEFAVDALINLVVFAQAYALMFLFVMIPIIMVLGRYSIGAAAGVSVMIFLLNLLPVAWALVAWMDNSNGVALWNGEGLFGTLMDLSPDSVKARLTHSIAIALLYASSATLLFSMIAVSGVRSAYALSNVGRSIGAGGGISPVGPVLTQGPTGKAVGGLAKRGAAAGKWASRR